MRKYCFLWVFLFTATNAQAVDPPPSGAAASGLPGATTFVPTSPVRPSTPQSATGSPTVPVVQVPTPDSIPAPSSVNSAQSPGQYRTARGEVKIEKMMLDRYRQSMVRVTARDLSGNELGRAMGVGVGRNAQYVAAPLSLVLGNSQQWADTIEITHAAGNKYQAQVVIIDEEKNLVLLAPEAHPAPLPFVRELDERPQTTVYYISFENNPQGVIQPNVHTGLLAAVNQETGLLSVAGADLQDSFAGTGLVNSQGELVGMLLPGGRGVLASTLQKIALRAQRLTTTLPPRMIGVILGRGVLVDPQNPTAFSTISAAFDAIKKGEAPKAHPERYHPAKDKSVAPKSLDRVIVKVMPGTYKEGKALVVPANVSLSGSGPDRTVLVGTSPDKPVVLLQKANNSSLSGFRIVPAALQQMKAPTVIVSESRDVSILGNVLEAKGGVALWVHQSQLVKILANAFARGQARALSCDRSDLRAEANAFLSDWPIAVSVDRECSAEIFRNLFLENKNSISVSSLVRRVKIERNTFVRNSVAIKLTANDSLAAIDDNLFFENTYGLFGLGNYDTSRIGRNAIWKTKFMLQGRNFSRPDFIRTEPQFNDPGHYDFRVGPGKSQAGGAAKEAGADVGAFQRADLLGGLTTQIAVALRTATGEKDLLAAWGLE